MFNLKELAWLF